MAFCNQCGAQIGEDTRFCTTCGADQGLQASEAPKQQSQYGQPYTQPANTQANAAQPGYVQPAYTQPNYAQQPPVGKPAETAVRPMGTWAYVGSILLMALPIAGFIIAIVWACGGTQNPNRRNLARATLILIAIGIVLSILFSAAMLSLFANIAQQYGAGSLDNFMYNFEGQMGSILPFLL